MKDALEDSFEFLSRQSQMPDLSEDGEPANLLDEPPSKVLKGTKVPSKRHPEQRVRKPYNTRSGPKVSYVDGESSADEDDDSEAILSPDAVSRSRARNVTKKTSLDKAKGPKASNGVFLKRRRPEEQVDSEAPQTAERRKRRQRPKTPLPIDDETQRVPTMLLTTPPVTDQRPKKCQGRRAQGLPAVESKPRARNKKLENASSEADMITSPELGSEQPTQVSSDSRSENGHPQFYNVALPEEIAQNEEDQDGSSIEQLAPSTRMTTPSVQPSPRRISSMQVPLPSRQLPARPSPPLIHEDVQDSVESASASRPPFMGDRSILMSRNVSKRDQDIGHRLQEIHKASALFSSIDKSLLTFSAHWIVSARQGKRRRLCGLCISQER